MVVTSQTRIYLHKNIKNLQNHLFNIPIMECERTKIQFSVKSSRFIIVLRYAYSILCMRKLSYSFPNPELLQWRLIVVGSMSEHFLIIATSVSIPNLSSLDGKDT